MVDTSKPARAGWRGQLWMAVALGALGVLGTAVEGHVDGFAWWYWILVLLVFALIGLKLKGRDKGERFWSAAGRQILHWLGVLVALNLVVALDHAWRLDPAADGVIALLILGTGCYAAAVHLHRIYIVTALLLWGGALMATYVQEQLWTVVGLLLVVGAGLYAFERFKSRK